jgi:hypothetical protein
VNNGGETANEIYTMLKNFRYMLMSIEMLLVIVPFCDNFGVQNIEVSG